MSGNNPTSVTLEEKLTRLPERSVNKQFIFRVRETLRNKNEEAYEPDMVSIGPYHRGKDKLQQMESYKLHYLKGIQKRQGEKSTGEFISYLRATIKELEQKARNCYAEGIKLGQEEFVDMMIVDGCFIAEFLRKYNVFNRKVEYRDNFYGKVKDDPIFSLQWLVESTCRDLLLFENQIPFFILEKMFALTHSGVEHLGGLIFSAISCLNHCFAADDPPESSYKIERPNIGEFHLLRLMYKTWCSSRDTQEEGAEHQKSFSVIVKPRLPLEISVQASVSPPRRSQEDSFVTPTKETQAFISSCGQRFVVSSFKSAKDDKTAMVMEGGASILDSRAEVRSEMVSDSLAKTWRLQCSSTKSPDPNDSDDELMTKALIGMPRKVLSLETVEDEEPIVTNLKLLKSACELKEHGIQFKKADESTSKSWLDIKFEDAVMKIPTFVVQDHTESLLRNLIACEEYIFDLGYPRKAVSDYASFMGCLLKSSEDAKMLRNCKIIKNLLGKDIVAEMFNKICNNIFLSPSSYTYKNTLNEVNEHCGQRRNKWMAELKKTYFNNPWSIIAFVAATFLLVLTVIQSIISILQQV